MTHQHATVWDAVAGVVSASGLGGSVVKEDRGFFEGVMPDGTTRTACVPDISYIDRSTRLRACVDTTIVTAHVTHDASAATAVLAAATRAEQQKVKAYGPFLRETPMVSFHPFAMELTGGFGPAAQDLLRACARSAASRGATGGGEAPLGTFYQAYLQRISVALQRSFAHSIRAWGARTERAQSGDTPSDELSSAWAAAQRGLRYEPDPLELSDLQFIASQ